jgi:hypothetical protein
MHRNGFKERGRDQVRARVSGRGHRQLRLKRGRWSAHMEPVESYGTLDFQYSMLDISVRSRLSDFGKVVSILHDISRQRSSPLATIANSLLRELALIERRLRRFGYSLGESVYSLSLTSATQVSPSSQLPLANLAPRLESRAGGTGVKQFTATELGLVCASSKWFQNLLLVNVEYHCQ